ncbi:MAG: transporter substrate-binding domain-containing protein [Solirubrobacteraceae bacterium]
MALEAVRRGRGQHGRGPKSFDFDINEISITPARAQAVDFSTPYYTNPQGIIVESPSPYAHATSLATFKTAKIGVQIGTTDEPRQRCCAGSTSRSESTRRSR